ncbi:PAQR family membrane homeostasis protein TrhA [Aurantivibrio plasticivorans]
MYHGEKFNSISHLVGAILALVGFGGLLTVAINTGDTATIISFAVFGATLVLLYTMSTLYHSFHPPRLKRVFRKFDHLTIYLLIAGTYTPYMMVSIGDSAGYGMLALVWGLAFIGVAIELLSPKRIEALQIIIYLFMGWVCVFHFSTLVENVGKAGVIWLATGGVAYTVGVVFYILDHADRLRHAHGIWHLFVLVGSLTHYVSIVGYVR